MPESVRALSPGEACRLPPTVRAIRVPLDSLLTPTDVLRAAARDGEAFALTGKWTGGGALVGSDPLVVIEGSDDPFGVLDHQPSLTEAEPDTVGGGWIGYLGYRLGSTIERVPLGLRRPDPPPGLMLGFYDHLLRYEAATSRWWFEALWSDEQATRLDARLQRWRRRLMEPPPERGEYHCGLFAPAARPEAHLLAVARAIEHIRSGDVYQVNVCLSLCAELKGDSLEAWCTGVEHLAPAYGAYLGYAGLSVASFSPELFLRRRGSEVLTSPIKGTAAAGPVGAQRLASSVKDRAENVMIVDLMRNDLGRVCGFGSVQVSDMCRVESHPGVWHLVSDIVGELRPGVSDGDVLRATFPPGSVTGAPKVRAMELIAALEAECREVYTGCLGIASPASGLELSVAIRTLEISGGTARLGVGGGIVADSDPKAEMEECFTKAAPLLAGIGARLEPAPLVKRSERSTPGRSVLGRVAEPGSSRRPDPALGVIETVLVLAGRPVALETHLARLATSVTALYGARLPATLGAVVVDRAAGKEGAQRLRILATPRRGSGLELELCFEPAHQVLEQRPGPPIGLIAVELAGGLGEHKWQDRRILADLRSERSGDQLLLVEPDGTVLEAERANVLAIYGNLLRTPPADGRILAGTTRDAVLRVASRSGMEVSCKHLDLEGLASADEVFLTSSISGVLPVRALDGRHWEAPGLRTNQLADRLWAFARASRHPR